MEIKGTWYGNTFEDVDLVIVSVLSLREEIEHDLRKYGFKGTIMSLLELVENE